MRFLVTLFVAQLFLAAAPLHAQELPPPPPPPETDAAETTDADSDVEPAEAPDATDAADAADEEASDPAADGEAEDAPTEETDGATGLTITEPAAGAEITTATVVRGTATPRAAVEIWIDDALEQRMKADANGRFKATISGLEPGTRVRIEVREIDSSGEMVASTSVVGRVTGAAPKETVENSTIVDETAPEEPERLAEPDPVVKPPATAEPQPKIEAPVGQLARGAISTGAGVVGGWVGLGVGFFGGLLVGAATNPDSFAFLAYALFGGIAGWAIAMPLSVYLTGYLLDGDGNVLLTVLATLAGLGLGAVGLAAIAESTNGLDDNASIPLFVGWSLIGAGSGALAFELTSNPSRKAAEQAENSITIAPTVAPSADGRGAVMGLGGRW